MKSIFYIIFLLFFISCELPTINKEDNSYNYSNETYHKNPVEIFINIFSDDYPMWNNSDMLKDLFIEEFEEKILNDNVFCNALIKASSVELPWYENNKYNRVYLMNYQIELDKPLQDNTKTINIHYEITSEITTEIFPKVTNKIIKIKDRRFKVYKSNIFIGSYKFI